MQTCKKLMGSVLAAGLLALAFATAAPLSLAQDFVWAPDFPVGSELPALEAVDQNGERRTFEDLVGDNGLLFMLNRSFDW
ncbi:MAG: hypothetical protein WD396_11520 [Pseudohongiellaceae bacterium]